MKTVRFLALIVTILTAILLASCNQTETAPEDTTVEAQTSAAETTVEAETTVGETTEEETTALTAEFSQISPAEGEELLLIDPQLQEWCLNYEANNATFSSEELSGKLKNCLCATVDLTWACDKSADGYTVKLWCDEKNVKVYETSSASLSLIDLFTNKTYNWQITVHTGDGDADSPVYSFKTCGEIRQLQLRSVDNLRDIGGYVTPLGTMKQGVAYRSAYLNKITKSGKKDALGIYGIKTELDLRGATESGNETESLIDPSVKYVNIAALQYTDILNHPEVMGEELALFADPANYPIIFHCSGGRDRTGTLAAILEMLCGVSEVELYRDYEITYIIPKSSTGAVPNEPAKTFIVSYFAPFVETLKLRYMTDDLSVCAEKLCLECGLTVDQINAIRDNLMEEGRTQREVSPILDIVEYHRIPEQDEPVQFYDAATLMQYTKTHLATNLGECTLGDGYVTISAEADGEAVLYVSRVPTQAAPFLLIKCRSTASTRALEFFIDTNSKNASSMSRCDAVYTNDGTWNYVIVDLESGAAGFDGVSCNHLRIDFLNHVNAGESIDVGYVGYFTSAAAAQKYAEAHQ